MRSLSGDVEMLFCSMLKIESVSPVPINIYIGEGLWKIGSLSWI